MDRVLSSENITTKYIAWLDMGYFRTLQNKTEYFKLEIPPDFNDSTVAYTGIKNAASFYSYNKSPWDIIKGNHVWVASGYFVATPEIMRKHVVDFRSATKDLLAKNMTSTDQQVLASLHGGFLPTKPSVVIQAVTCRRRHLWFCLGLKCLDAAAMRDWQDDPDNITRIKSA